MYVGWAANTNVNALLHISVKLNKSIQHVKFIIRAQLPEIFQQRVLFSKDRHIFNDKTLIATTAQWCLYNAYLCITWIRKILTFRYFYCWLMQRFTLLNLRREESQQRLPICKWYCFHKVTDSEMLLGTLST